MNHDTSVECLACVGGRGRIKVYGVCRLQSTFVLGLICDRPGASSIVGAERNHFI